MPMFEIIAPSYCQNIVAKDKNEAIKIAQAILKDRFRGRIIINEINDVVYLSDDTYGGKNNANNPPD